MTPPVRYTLAILAAVTDALRAGRSLWWVTRQPWGPCHATLVRWRRKYPPFADAIAQARAEGPPPSARTDDKLWSETLKDDLLARIASGRSIRSVCADPDMPCTATVHHWRRHRPGFAHALLEATGAAGARMRRPSPGRPRAYGEDVAQAILDRLAEGELLAGICRDRGMPAVTTVIRWRHDRADFGRAYQRIREAQAEALADSVVILADAAVDVALAELQIEARKWRLMQIVSPGGRRPPPPPPLAWRR